VQSYQQNKAKGNEMDEMDGNLIFDDTGDLGKSFGASLFATILFIGIGAGLVIDICERMNFVSRTVQYRIEQNCEADRRVDQGPTRRMVGTAGCVNTVCMYKVLTEQTSISSNSFLHIHIS
jgi:hypothetical protein